VAPHHNHLLDGGEWEFNFVVNANDAKKGRVTSLGTTVRDHGDHFDTYHAVLAADVLEKDWSFDDEITKWSFELTGRHTSTPEGGAVLPFALAVFAMLAFGRNRTS
jgi:hypothetical protein